MDPQAILKELETLGTPQNRKIYGRHGVKGEMYGVSFGDLKTLKKKIKVDHSLAQQLWATGNHDAKILATMLADPKQATELTLDSWVHELTDYIVADAFSTFVSKTSFARQKAAEWSRSKDEYISRTGWHLIAYLAQNDEALPNDFFDPYLAMIEQDIHHQPNRAREAMNNTLIAIGCRNPALQERSLAIAQKIGEVYIDHGETSCKTPDAIVYIHKTVERKKEKGQWN